MRLNAMTKGDLIELVLYLDKKNKRHLFQRLIDLLSSGHPGTDWIPNKNNIGSPNDIWIKPK